MSEAGKRRDRVTVFAECIDSSKLPARHNPIAADFPLPLAAVSATVDFKVFSEIASKKDRTALAWSIVFASETKLPTLGVSSKEA